MENLLAMRRAREIPSASFHEPQCAAGIVPADQSKQSTAGKMPAAPWPRRLTSWRFMVPMHGRQFGVGCSSARRLAKFFIAGLLLLLLLGLNAAQSEETNKAQHANLKI